MEIDLESPQRVHAKKRISQVTKLTRRDLGLSQRKFSEAISEKLPGTEISENLVNHWESGRQTPAYLLLVGMTLAYSDWRYDWALACLQAIKPELWGEAEPAAVVGND